MRPPVASAAAPSGRIRSRTDTWMLLWSGLKCHGVRNSRLLRALAKDCKYLILRSMRFGRPTAQERASL